MELALGTVYPNQQTCHTVPVQNGYAVVQLTYVWPNARHIKLPIPVEDEITTLADSLLQCIQLPRLRILIPSRSRDPNSAAPSAGNTASDATTLALRQKSSISRTCSSDSSWIAKLSPSSIRSSKLSPSISSSTNLHSSTANMSLKIWKLALFGLWLIQSTSLVSLCCQKRL